jgi:anti-anti-sigma factor
MAMSVSAHPDDDASGGGAWPRPDGVQRLRIDVRSDGDEVRVTPVGEVDIATVGQIDELIGGLHGAGFHLLVLDLRELTFMDSTGLQLAVRWDSYARQNGYSFAIIQGTPSIQRIFDITDLADRLPFRSF